MRALISVSDKTGILEFAKGLKKLGFEIISTGGTAKALKDGGVEVIGVSDITGFPECLDGRVKTLHPKIHAGILARRDNPKHMKQLSELGVDTIDVVAINLYPFKETISKANVTLDEAIENIDIGGPTAIRAAAKNWQDVAVVVDPEDYEVVISELDKGEISLKTKQYLSYKVFEHTAHYDALIANYLREKIGADKYPATITRTYEMKQGLRYGENPHQSAAFYAESIRNKGTLADAKQLQGKELSYNNINDISAAMALVNEFDEKPTVVALKHANPCGVGEADTIAEAYKKAYDADSVSIYGGIIACNRTVSAEMAEELIKTFIECIIAPDYEPEALEIMKAKPNMRVLKGNEKCFNKDVITTVSGGVLIQDADTENYNELKVVTDRAPTDKEMEDLLFTWKVVKYVKSNGIALGKDGATVGIGPGQPNRITSLNIAINNGGDKVKGSVMASDAFFPFEDCVKAAADSGITAIIQPGGSIRDEESIRACDEAGIAMVFTGMRHFRH